MTEYICKEVHTDNGGYLEPVKELIRCKDCKHHYYDGDGIFYCEKHDYGYGWKDDDFCSKAERKERMTLDEVVKKINDAIYDAFGWLMEAEERKE